MIGLLRWVGGLVRTPGRQREGRALRERARFGTRRVQGARGSGCVRVLAALLVLALLSCFRSSQDPAASFVAPPPTEPSNVLLISIDTLRADHLGCYGYTKPTSPRIDAFGESSTRFADAYSAAPWTLPAHAEMLTGQDPHALGVIHKRSAIPDDVPMLAEILRSVGYETAAFVDSSKRGLVGAERGFARGFSEYHHAPHRTGLAFEYDAAVTVEEALEWLRSKRDRSRPFFLFLHTKSVHTVRAGIPRPDVRTPPYDVPEGDRFRFVTEDQARLAWNAPERGEASNYLNSLNEDYQRRVDDPDAFPADQLEALIGMYDSAIRYTDEQFGLLLEGLAAEQLLESTLVVVTADHGEEFLDHGRFLHEQVYRELLHVPLILRIPGRLEGRVIPDDVSLADIVPTIVDALGIATSIAFAGRSLLDERPTNGARAFLASYHEALPKKNRFAFHGLCSGLSRLFAVPPDWLSGCLWSSRRYSLRRGDWTLVYNEHLDDRRQTTELYRNDRDSAQKQPIEDEGVAVELLSTLLQQRTMIAERNARSIALDEKTREQLEALGYVAE